MKAVIFNDKTQEEKINNLLTYIKKLCQVDVEVITWNKIPTYLNDIGRYNETFRYTASKIKDDFLWLEYDSIPTDEECFSDLKDVWESIEDSAIQGMMCPDFQSPFDMSCPVGIYKKGIRDLVPQGLQQCTFHSWLSENKNDYIERTGLIQHSGGLYSLNGQVRNHLFPRDNWILRENSVIFHSDKDQSIITDYNTPISESDEYL